MRLRDVRLADLDSYLRLRCDAEVMAHLGGPLPRDAPCWGTRVTRR